MTLATEHPENVLHILVSTCAGIGAVGATLIVLASLFTNVGINFRKRPFYHAVFFVAGGNIAAGICHLTGHLQCAAIGAGWLYFAITLREAGRALSKTILPGAKPDPRPPGKAPRQTEDANDSTMQSPADSEEHDTRTQEHDVNGSPDHPSRDSSLDSHDDGGDGKTHQ